MISDYRKKLIGEIFKNTVLPEHVPLGLTAVTTTTMLLSSRSSSFIFIFIYLTFIGFSSSVERQTRLPIGLTGYDVVIQYTLYGEDTTTHNWGGGGGDANGTGSTEEEEWDILGTGSNIVAAAAVAASPNSVDSENKIIKLELEPLDTKCDFCLVASFEFEEEIDMQAARIIWGREDIECSFDRAGFEYEMHPPELTFGKTLEFPWDTIEVPVNGILCKSPDVVVRSELV